MNYIEMQQEMEQKRIQLGMGAKDFACTPYYREMYPKLKAAHEIEYGKRQRRKRPKPVAIGSEEFYARLFSMPK